MRCLAVLGVPESPPPKVKKCHNMTSCVVWLKLNHWIFLPKCSGLFNLCTLGTSTMLFRNIPNISNFLAPWVEVLGLISKTRWCPVREWKVLTEIGSVFVWWDLLSTEKDTTQTGKVIFGFAAFYPVQWVSRLWVTCCGLRTTLLTSSYFCSPDSTYHSLHCKRRPH